ncbi:D-Ala-D-Ala carboxypeptidase family metallohydrolase [Mesorhizobium silamurunense]|uniref:D-Ala-D-Ala carboxypeptidase family metallohydrolase n=1 Tax=Mesorhizobium silamurunense TaxID=499528 RepID=UPI00177B61A1|nr:D-Ala-D-Ala carboxypeptidase family metallohydrolase [Mesorhizobium silamurunense]
MARAPVHEISAPSALQGIAAPVNTYVRPADPAPSSLHQLAEGLAALDDGLGDFMVKRKAKGDEADKQRAIRDAYVNSGEGQDEAVKRGLIPPHESTTYMKWYKATQGDVRGRQLIDQFDVAYNQWPDRNSGDPEKFKEFVGGFLKEHVGEDTDPEVLAGLNPHLEQIFSGGYANFTKDRADTVYGGALAAAGASMTDHISRAGGDARAAGSGIDYETLWGTLMGARDEALKRNLEKDVDGFLVDSVILQAEESSNEDLLTLLDRRLPGKEYAISSDVEVRKKIYAAREHIGSKLASAATTLAAQEEKEDKARHNALVAGELTKINADAKYQIPEDTLKEISKRDPEFRSKLPGYRRSILEGDTAEDPDALMEAFSKIDGGAGTAYVLELRAKGVIRDPKTLTQMLDRVHTVEKASQSDGILQSPAYKDTVKMITNATGQGPMDFMDQVRGLTDDGARALYDYRTQLLQWSADNPNATIMEREKAAMDIGKSIRDRIVANPEADEKGQQGVYPQPGEQQPKAEQPQSPAEPPAGPASQQPAEQPPAAETPSDASTPLPPGPRADAANELARKYNISPEVAHEMLLEEERNDAGPTPEARPGAAQEVPADSAPSGFGMIGNIVSGIGSLLGFGSKPQEQPQSPDDRGALNEDTRTRLTSLLRNPPMLEDGRSSAGNTPVAPLLNLLGHTEGTDKGEDYNETLGYGKFTGGKVNLEGMTLDQIDQLQTQILSHPENDFDASPVGRYQIVRKTLRSLRRALGLSGDELFDRKMQDRLSMALLERRGLSRWQSGQMSDAEFMRSLGQEWASLPGRQGALRETLGQVKKGGSIQVASTDPEAGFREWLQQQEGQGGGNGPADLITSAKRGYQPDMEHLKPALKSKVSELQKSFGQSLPIVSGFRDTQRNARAGGAKHSQHIHGNAVDIDVSHLSRADRVKLIQAARAQGFGGIGVYANSIHLDIGKRRAWGPSHSSDSIPAWARDALA